ncbi:MAG: hypothetical protein WA364_12115 [Candidatus Nitrosopolaris sp.]
MSKQTRTKDHAICGIELGKNPKGFRMFLNEFDGFKVIGITKI